MRQKTKWPWKIYFFLSAYVSISNVLGIFLHESPIDQYYRILIIFKKSYWIGYGLHQAAIAVEMLCLLPLFLFVFHKKFLNPLVWQLLFAARILLFIFAYSYEKMMLRSYFYANPLLAAATIGVIIFLFFPSLIAHLLYAFYPQKLFPKA